jgi:hypothetical protein
MVSPTSDSRRSVYFLFPRSLSSRPDNQNGGGQHGNQGGRETGFEEVGDGRSSLVTEGTGEDTGTYKYVSLQIATV